MKNNTYKIILWVLGALILIIGVVLFIIPPAVFPDPASGLQVLQSMQHGSGFNTFAAPDQSDISQDYTEYLTWWSPGQYLVPYLFKLLFGLSMGHSIALTITLCTAVGIAGLFCFFKKIGFSPLVSAISLVFIMCQLAFFIPYAYYNGGETLLFAFLGWFLYGCAAFEKPGVKIVLFVLVAGWIGFFCKSSFIWMYVAGLCCLWIRLSLNGKGILEWMKKGLWVGIPAVLSLVCIYIFFLSKGESPASVSKGFSFNTEAFTYPLASPLLGGFSIDDLLHWMLYSSGKPLLSAGWDPAVLFVIALSSVLLVVVILRKALNANYRLCLMVFYFGALLFFSFVYLKQLNISYESRHFRVISLLIVPGIILLLERSKVVYKIAFAVICLVIAGFSLRYLIKGFSLNENVSARGITGIAQPNIDQQSLNKIMQLDRQNRNAIFVFICNDVGLEITNNRVVTLLPIHDDLKINRDDYTYEGFGGPLYIVLPESYNGPKEKMIMKSFPGYTGFNVSMLSKDYVLYEANTRRVEPHK